MSSRTLIRSCIQVRAGLHTGECEVRGDDIGGIAVHIGARVSALAGPDEVLVSSTLRDLVGQDSNSKTAAHTSSKGCPANGISSPSPLRSGGLRRNSPSPSRPAGRGYSS